MKVTTLKVTTLTVSPTSKTLAVGETVTLTHKATDSDGANCAGCTVTFASSNSSVATVDANGKVTAVARGTATITARADSASTTASISVS